ncbi:MAG TPA: DUF885 domain-containing protein [Candidatus Deferrimicrobium sp.]|nr:DUF885 domain-containing protein [Candidatus Deferrimicrobium sp.]
MSVAQVAVSRVHVFADRAWEQYLELNPLWATSQGDERWDDRLDDPGPEGRAAQLAMVEGWASDLQGFDGTDLPTEDAVTLDLMHVVVTRVRQAHDLRLWEMEAIDQYGGPQGLIGDLARLQRADTPERLARLLARLAAYPSWMEAHRANVEASLVSGRTAAAPVVERCITQTRRMLEAPAEQSPIVLANASLDDATRNALVDAVARYVRPAHAAWLAMLERYAGRVRPGDGICHLPDGDALYRHHILAWTTLAEDARSIHEYGLERLAEVEAQGRRIATELHFGGIGELRRFLEASPGNHAEQPEQLISMAQELVARAEAQAPRWFGRLPSDGCGVRAVEPHMEQEAPPAFYVPPSEDGSRRGAYYINTYETASRPLHRLAATTFHEAVPGHHFQIAIEQELPDLPAFRRFGSRLAGGAYVEGWALYAERLAGEMGLYRDPRERFGALESEAWRAARLVVDSGIHALGWTRQQSIDLLRERAGLSRLEAETETDRYISWPGQALSYMIGQREILDLRAQLERRDGDRFDPRAFHDATIGHGSLPLSTLRAQLPGWVKPRDG